MMNIKQRHLQMLLKIFSGYCPTAEIWAYGSRIKSNSHSGSDLDLTVKNWGKEKKSISELRQLINDSDIPFLIEITEYDKIPSYMQLEILKEYVRIFPIESEENEDEI